MNLENLLNKLIDGDQLTSSDTIAVSNLKHPYSIIRNESDFFKELKDPIHKFCIILTKISIKEMYFDIPINCEGWVFANELDILGTTFERKVNFSNCYFLNTLLIDNANFNSNLIFDFSFVKNAELTFIDFRKTPTSFIRFSVIQLLKITYCKFDTGFSIQYRDLPFKLNLPTVRPIFDFSFSHFNSSFSLDISHYIDPKPIIVVNETIFMGDVYIGYDGLKDTNFKSLQFDHSMYLNFITDSLADKIRFKSNTNHRKLKYKTTRSIKNNFDTLYLYYQNKDTDKMLDLRYYYMKYSNKLNLYESEQLFSWKGIKNNIRWFFSFAILDLPFKYFTCWKRTLATMATTLSFFFSIFLLFANKIQFSNGKAITQNDFYINFHDKIDIDRISDVVYFTLITFTTIGYGDLQPTGFLKFIAGIEGLIGILLVSIFTVTLAKRILG